MYTGKTVEGTMVVLTGKFILAVKLSVIIFETLNSGAVWTGRPLFFGCMLNILNSDGVFCDDVLESSNVSSISSILASDIGLLPPRFGSHCCEPEVGWVVLSDGGLVRPSSVVGASNPLALGVAP